MLVTNAQIRALEKAQIDRFVRQLATHLRLSFADVLKNKSAEDVLAISQLCCDNARLFGIELADDVRRYAEFSVTYGDRMHEDRRYPWIGRVLTSSGISGTGKMDMLDWLELQIPPVG